MIGRVISGGVAADLDVQRRARGHCIIAVLHQDSRAAPARDVCAAGGNGRAAVCNELTRDRTCTLQRLAVRQDHGGRQGTVS